MKQPQMRWSFRTLLRAAFLAAACPLGSAAQEKLSPFPRDTVLFVCEHGTVKSLLAKLEFDRLATAAGLPVVALSRGSAVDSAVPPWMRAALARDGQALGDWVPQALQSRDLLSAALVVSFDLPMSVTAGAGGARAQWDGLPSVSTNYLAGSDAVRQRVRLLVDSLVRQRMER